ncbi:hypothetical protein GGTG_04521 [Gaeumannomyces tritici R3-111a-1]|uniref:Uncharacterized protein n=1 Tax=Gaeumannomyces tritici (strain R3-111a-1) TaxID=644352 RepID=J3NTC2_GAET3|nr:hypothetical protein GGTG_04521 [Gaeumannomyces tritici R3-111a-1]EJT79437.1 hypothetical protein GGTG_04521 [Gaeumannomyces tritici R3-111a-1]
MAIASAQSLSGTMKQQAIREHAGCRALRSEFSPRCKGLCLCVAHGGRIPLIGSGAIGASQDVSNPMVRARRVKERGA